MKKLLFVLAFTFIGQQVFSQLYIVSVLSIDSDPTSTCTYSGYDLAIYVVDPTGTETVTCIDDDVDEYGLKTLAQVLNNIIAQGYKITNIQTGAREGEGALTFLQTKNYDPTFGGVPTEELLPGTTFFLSVPLGSMIVAKFYSKKKGAFLLVFFGMNINALVMTTFAYYLF